MRLFARAAVAAGEIGITLEHGTFGGGSDGNFTGALGIPTLDGLGAIGAGVHTLEEHVLISELAPRARLVCRPAGRAGRERPMNAPTIRDVLDFWFLPLDHPDHGKPRDIWWKGPAEFDAEIRERFARGARHGHRRQPSTTGESHPTQGAGADPSVRPVLAQHAPARLAGLLAGDRKALPTARLALARNYPALPSASPCGCSSTCPSSIARSLTDQELGCSLFAAFEDEEMMKHAHEHRDVIVRFGRFPHRNEVLERNCTGRGAGVSEDR